MQNNLYKKGLVFGIIMLFVGTGTVSAKSLYVNKDLNANSPISAYDIQGPPNYLVYQMTSVPTRYGGAGLAIDTESEILFVTFETSGVLDIVDAKTLNKLGTVTAPSATNLAGIVVDQDKQKVYAVDRNTNHLYVYSWDSVNKILSNDVTLSPYYISLTGVYYTGGHDYGLHGIALDEVHDLLYACDVTTTIKIFNTANWSPAGSFTVSQRAMGIAVDVKNGFVYTGNAYAPYGSLHLLSKYNLNTNTESTINIGSYDNVVGLAVDQDTGFVYITTGDQGSGGSDQIRLYDSNLNFQYATGDIGDPTGLAIPSEKTGIHPPDANPGGPYYGNINEPIQLFGSGTAAKDRTIESWEWTFDDTSVKSTEQNPSHTWSTAGQYIATLTVYDNKGLPSKPKECKVCVVEPFNIVHMTDIHIGSIIPKYIDEWELSWSPYKADILKASEILTTTVEKIKVLKPDIVLVTGDIADKADEKLYTEYKTIMGELSKSSIEYYNVPGNHDRYWPTEYGPIVPKSIAYYYQISNKLNYDFEHKGFIFIGLDSGYVMEEKETPGGKIQFSNGIAGGAIDSYQRQRLEKQPSFVPKIIFMHHPVFDIVPREGLPNYKDMLGKTDDFRIQNDRDWFINNYCLNSKVALVLTGHTHDDLIYNKYGTEYDSTGDKSKLHPPWYNHLQPFYIQTPSLTAPRGSLNDCSFRNIRVKAGTIPNEYYRINQENDLKIKWVLNSPATLHAYDSIGRHTGINFTKGAIEQNIPHTYYLGGYTLETINETNATINITAPPTIISYNLSEDYLVRIIANLTEEQKLSPQIEHFNFSVELQKNNSLTKIFYTNVPLYENTTAMLHSNMSTTNFTMEIDYNGDGTTDDTKLPDYIITDFIPTATIILPINNSIHIYGEEIAFNGTGTDIEDGILTNSSLIWMSNIDNYIGNGSLLRTTNLSVGTHTIELFVNDSRGQIDSKNVTITVVAPDLRIDASNISFSKLSPVISENIIINATIYNLGTANASNISVRFFNGNPLNNTQIGENQTIESLNVNEGKTVAVIWNTTGCAGDNYIWVVVDSSNDIKESDEENNCAYTSVFVGAPDLLHIMKVKPDRIAYLEGETVLISCLVQNASGNISATVTAYIEEPDGDMNQMTMIEGSIGNYSRTFSNTYVSGLYNITIVANRIGFTGDNEFFSFKILDTSSPSRINNLSNTTGSTWINWSWDKPKDADFDHVLVYLNGVWKDATSKSYYLAEELIPGAQYEIGILTVDKAGNINKRWVNQTTLMEGIIDNTPPFTIKTISSPKYGTNDIWVTSNTEFNFTATDDSSGVQVTYYRIWYNGVWTPLLEYTGNFTLSCEGKHYLEYYSVDNAGNVESNHNQTHYVDDTPPAVKISASPNRFWRQERNYMKNVLISGSATDAGSGIVSITFTVVDEYDRVEPTITQFGQTIQLEAWRNRNDMDGRMYTITATATDNLRHVATASTLVIATGAGMFMYMTGYD